MNLDLHLHTTASDGLLSPADVVRAAAAGGLDVISITDHDTVAGVAEAIAVADALGGTAGAADRPIRVVPGIEVSARWLGADLHILGYFIDPTHPALVDHAGAAMERRRSRMVGMVERLRGQGVEVPFESVVEQAAGAHSIGRPHLARALVAHGVVDSVPLAFDLYIGNHQPAYLPAHVVDAPEAVRLIRAAGGVAVWAHPRIATVRELLPSLKDVGMGGVEIYRPGAFPDRIAQLEGAARHQGLVASGGSDWHGPSDGPLGEFRVSAERLADLLALGDTPR